MLVPSLYVFNGARLAKPHAIEHLQAELSSYKADIGVVTETHFKLGPTDGVINNKAYVVYRRDRAERREVE